MTFYLLDKNKLQKRNVDFKTFWDFYDEKDEHISGIKFVHWKDEKNYTYLMDLARDTVVYSEPQLARPKFKKWPQYEAFKNPITDYEEDACF